MIDDLRTLLWDNGRQVWDDEELQNYLDRSLGWWNLYPPQTDIETINDLCRDKIAWRTPILWGAVFYAVVALELNWVSEGSFGITTEQFNKYKVLKTEAEKQFDRAGEAKTLVTVDLSNPGSAGNDQWVDPTFVGRLATAFAVLEVSYPPPDKVSMPQRGWDMLVESRTVDEEHGKLWGVPVEIKEGDEALVSNDQKSVSVPVD